MTKYSNLKPLGAILQTAGLVSSAQIQVALIDRQYNQDLRVGEILAIRGWIEQQTADFFAEEWQLAIEQPNKYPLGYYLKKSGLLSEKQINYILEEQKQLWVKFGAVAILQGLLEKTTVDFFLNNLFPGASLESPFINKKKSYQPTETADTTSETQTDLEDILWIG